MLRKRMIYKAICILLAAALSAFAFARILEPPRISAVSWSDERLAEMASERPELLPQALRAQSRVAVPLVRTGRRPAR